MSGELLLGIGKKVTSLPSYVNPIIMLGFSIVVRMVQIYVNFVMTEEHRTVQSFLAKELLDVGTPLSTDYIAQKLGIPTSRIEVILKDMERSQLLLKNKMGWVTCVYPVRSENPKSYKDLHRVTFENGKTTEIP